MPALFHTPEHYRPAEEAYTLLPFRFSRLDSKRYVAVNEVGEWQVLERTDLESLVKKTLNRWSPLYQELQGKHFLIDADSSVGIDLLTLKYRTKRQRMAEFTSLHMFVVSLRCNHTCKYCQVSRQSEDRAAFDMTEEIADRAIDFTFRSPSRSIKIEFQGGEPLLNFPLIKYIVVKAKERNLVERRNLAFVVTTNLSPITDEILAFCQEHDIYISCSLDGPEDLHNANRPKEGNNSYRLTLEGIRRVRESLGIDHIGALMTTTQASLPRAEEIIDEYVRQGFSAIFLRPLSPYGFAIKTKCIDGYTTQEWLEFYKRGLDYIIELNRKGLFFVEHFAALILRKMLTPYDTGFVNLQSPAGLGIAAIVFNYNGEVYPSDEARMKAEMGDRTFRMGHLLINSYEEMMLSPAFLSIIEDTVAETVPMCEECAFLPYCGSDPDYHYATQGDFVGHKAISGFCRKNMGVFRHIIQRMEDDAGARSILESWVQWW
jgi:uncharacterized protein